MTKASVSVHPAPVSSHRGPQRSTAASAQPRLLSKAMSQQRLSQMSQQQQSMALGAPWQQQVTVLDEQGNDVTPRPLLAVTPRAAPGGEKATGSARQSTVDLTAASGKLNSSVLGQTSLKVPVNQESSSFMDTFQMGSMQQIFGLNLQASVNQQRPRSSSTFGASMAEDDDNSSMMSTESAEEDPGPSNTQIMMARGRKPKTADMRLLMQSSSGKSAAQQKMKELPEDYVVTLALTESDTIFMLDIPSLSIGTDVGEEANVVAANERYAQVKQLHLTSDNYTGRGCQTLNDVVKSKDVQAVLFTQNSVGVQATNWDIYDANQELLEANEAQEVSAQEGDSGAVVALGNTQSDSVAASTGFASNAAMSKSFSETIPAPVAGSTNSIAGNGETSMADTSSVASSEADVNTTPQPQASSTTSSDKTSLDKINPESLLRGLRNMEIAIMHNNHLRKLTNYFDLPDVPPVVFETNEKPPTDELEFLNRPKRNDKKANELGSSLPSLQLLWTFKCELTKGRPVNYMVWNKKNPNILAVAYDEARLTTKTAAKQSPGLILVWSLKNLEYPDRIYKFNSSVKALDFSAMNPSLLAAGFQDGNIMILDIRSRSNVPVLDTNGSTQHHDPVWDVCWVEHEQLIGEEQSKAESLASISTDGRVKEWSLKKGMEGIEIMSLKRVSNKQTGKNQKADDKSGSFVSRLSGGLCFDFNKFNPKLYIVGTEEGVIHKCSRSYEGQYLDSYYGHHGPVYKIQWSPFAPQVFASCGADWTIQVWREHNQEAAFKLQSGRVPVNDIVWSPHSATVVMSVYDDGRIEIWDLSHSLLSPVILHTVLDHRLTRAIFAPTGPSLATGDDNGAVCVYKMRNFKRAMMKDVPAEEQTKQLHEILASKDKKADENDGESVGAEATQHE